MTTAEKSQTPGQMALNSLTTQTQVTLYPLMIQAEDNGYIVGRIETGEFVALPEVGVQVINFFQRGCSVEEVRRRLQAEYGVEVDIDGFVASLVDLGFVKELDGHSLNPTNTK